MDAREIESLSMITRGFEELRDVNPELAYNVILDVLSGINECVLDELSVTGPWLTVSNSNQHVRQYVNTSRGLFPHKRIIRRSEITTKGLVVTEEEEVSGLPSTSSAAVAPPIVVDDQAPRKSPIAELLYMRWLEGLRLKWPSILSA